AALLYAVAAALTPSSASSQQEAPGPAVVDSVVVEGNRRVQAQAISALFGIQPGQEITYRDIQRGIKSLVGTGQFRNVTVRARGTSAATLVVTVEEQDVVRSVVFNGLESVSAGAVRDTANLTTGAPLNRQRILDAKAFIREELVERGIPFAQIEERVEPVPDGPGEVRVIFDVREGNRVTVADVEFTGNTQLADDALEGVIST